MVVDFAPGHKTNHESPQKANHVMEDFEQLGDRPPYSRRRLVVSDSSQSDCSEPVVLRIDNIAWDATPEMLEQFLPPGVLADTLQPVHLLLSRWDGRSKDYLVSIPPFAIFLSSRSSRRL